MNLSRASSIDISTISWSSGTARQSKNVVSLPEGCRETHTGGTETVNFEGSRLELLSNQPLAVWPSVMIDGRSPSDFDGCYQVTRASPLKSVPDWPTVRRITLLHNHTAQDWTATITNISPDQKSADFTVKASATGDEGSGNSSRKYVSKSGQLSIDADDWMFESGYTLKHIPLQVPAEVHWSVQYVCGGKPEVIDRGNGMTEYRYVLGTGLSNRKSAQANIGSPRTSLRMPSNSAHTNPRYDKLTFVIVNE